MIYLWNLTFTHEIWGLGPTSKVCFFMERGDGGLKPFLFLALLARKSSKMMATSFALCMMKELGMGILTSIFFTFFSLQYIFEKTCYHYPSTLLVNVWNWKQFTGHNWKCSCKFQPYKFLVFEWLCAKLEMTLQCFLMNVFVGKMFCIL